MVNKTYAVKSASGTDTAAWMNERVWYRGRFMVRACALDIAAAGDAPERDTAAVAKLPEWTLESGDAMSELVRAVFNSRPKPIPALSAPTTINDPDYPVSARQLA
jgi:hypothetical protein